MGFTSHFDKVHRRTITRLGVLAQLARRVWALEVGVIKSTHNALTGTAAYESQIDSLEMQCANTEARRKTVVPRTARPGLLRAVTGMTSARNHYTQECGLLIGCTLRGHESVVEANMERFSAPWKSK